MKKNLKVDLRQKYRRSLELGFVGALLICQIFFLAIRQIGIHAEPQEVELPNIQVEQIPRTEPPKNETPPERPKLPIPSEDETIPETETIAPNTEFDFSNIGPAPELPSADDIVFIVYDKEPELIEGISSIQKFLKYPERARKLHFEGVVYLRILVDANGMPSKIKVFKSSGYDILDNAAVAAAKNLRWIPAMQRDKAVKVWVAIPIRFVLN